MSDSRPKKTVLILDDSDVVLELARKYLQDAGFSVLTALNLKELDRHLTSSEPHLILLDVQMPELQGDDLGRRLRNERGVEVPIVLFSTLDEDELEQLVRDAGLDGFVSKNAGLQALVAHVSNMLR